uniref:Uncharacterized protein n=1 Tax=Sphaerodactylus townsendi TaxID=933632 RepID=A0ACB8GB43_9SAUR
MDARFSLQSEEEAIHPRQQKRANLFTTQGSSRARLIGAETLYKAASGRATSPTGTDGAWRSTERKERVEPELKGRKEGTGLQPKEHFADLPGFLEPWSIEIMAMAFQASVQKIELSRRSCYQHLLPYPFLSGLLLMHSPVSSAGGLYSAQAVNAPKRGHTYPMLLLRPHRTFNDSVYS